MPDDQTTCDVRNEECDGCDRGAEDASVRAPEVSQTRKAGREALRRVEAAVGSASSPGAGVVTDGRHSPRDRAGDRPTDEPRQQNDRGGDRVPASRRKRQRDAFGEERGSDESGERERLQLRRGADEDAPQSDEGQRRRRVGKGDDRGMTRYADAAAVLGARPRRVPALCCHSSFTAVATACLSLDRGTMPLTGELASLGRVRALVLWPPAIAHVERRSCCLVDPPRTVCLSCPAVSQPEPNEARLAGSAGGTCSRNRPSGRLARQSRCPSLP